MHSDDERLEKLITQCKSNDVDVKVDALTKLQVAFESGLEVRDPDDLVGVLKACLRTSNQHLSTATLAALPPLLPLLLARTVGHTQPSSNQPRSPSSSSSSVYPPGVVDAVMLRQVLNAFLPAGGLIERLGDKERAQMKAREALVILGGFAFRTGNASALSTKSRDKSPETPLAIFERFIREAGLGSKVWKVREQSLLTLVHLRRNHHQFPIRPYLSLLIDCLEDTDAHVRDCARQSVIELFTGPGVTDGARADLKKEMSKKNVRKTIVDGVLSKILGGSLNSNPESRDGSENGDPSNSIPGEPKEYVPPSLMLQGRKPTTSSQNGGITRAASHGNVKDISRPNSRAANIPPSVPPSAPSATMVDTADIQSIYIASAKDLENEFAAMQKPFEGKETEHNWADRERAIIRVRGMLKGEVHTRYYDTFLACLKDGFIQWSLKTLASLRTTVAVHTTSLYSELAASLGTALDPFCDVLLTNLLKMAALTKKLTSQQSQAAVTLIIARTSGQPRIFIPLLCNMVQEKTVQARVYGAGHLKHYIEVHAQRAKNSIENSGGLEALENALKKVLIDPNPAVRGAARAFFWDFEGAWPERGSVVLHSQDSTIRKQIEKACPKPELVSNIPPMTPRNPKKSSVAAAIAASRAKAKAIATAPPSLHHQATSSSSHPIKRDASPGIKSTNMRPPSPLTLTSRSRTVSGNQAINSHSKSPSGDSGVSGRATTPPSPSTFRRRASSPLATTAASVNRPSAIRKVLIPGRPPLSPNAEAHIIRSASAINWSAPTTAVPPTSMDAKQVDADSEDQVLLMAQSIPVPDEDSDSEGDHSINLMSFSAPYEMYPPTTLHPKTPRNKSRSPKSDDSKPTVISTALSSGSVIDIAHDPLIVEDALRARAEQAESAAERLLELVDPEEDGAQHSSIPPSLLVGSSNGYTDNKHRPKPAPLPIPQHRVVSPTTPVSKNAAIMRQAAMFKDSPARNGHSSSLVEALQINKHETGWWLKRQALIAQGTLPRVAQPAEKVQELQGYITALAGGEAAVHVLQRLTLFSMENRVSESSPPHSPVGMEVPISPSPLGIDALSPSSLHDSLWEVNKNFERLFEALLKLLEPTKTEQELEYGLILLWEMLENQGRYLEGRESDLFSALFRVRYCNKLNILEATSTIRDALTATIEPVYGLTTLHASLRAFYAERDPGISDSDAKSASYAFGLIAIGKFILRLPAEIAEEELPRLKFTLISSLNDKTSLIVRESAAAAIIAAQLVLHDETHLFALLDGLADEKKNLLTYLFDKHGVRQLAPAIASSGTDKLEKEIRRLDVRTSTPSRPAATAHSP